MGHIDSPVLPSARYCLTLLSALTGFLPVRSGAMVAAVVAPIVAGLVTASLHLVRPAGCQLPPDYVDVPARSGVDNIEPDPVPTQFQVYLNESYC